MTLVHRPPVIIGLEDEEQSSMKNQNNLPEFDLNRVFFTMHRRSIELRNLLTVDKMSINDVISFSATVSVQRKD